MTECKVCKELHLGFTEQCSCDKPVDEFDARLVNAKNAIYGDGDYYADAKRRTLEARLSKILRRESRYAYNELKST